MDRADPPRRAIELWNGLPEHLEPRVGRLVYAPDWGQRFPSGDDFARDELVARVWGNPVLFPDGQIPWNAREVHAAEIPAVNAIGTARAIARLYGCLARGGELDGVHLLSAAALERGTTCLARRRDSLQDDPSAFGIGFELQTELMRLGPPAGAFGHTGAGGSCHGARPGERMGFSYCMNQMRDVDLPDPRPRALLNSLYESL